MSMSVSARVFTAKTYFASNQQSNSQDDSGLGVSVLLGPNIGKELFDDLPVTLPLLLELRFDLRGSLHSSFFGLSIFLLLSLGTF